MKGRNGMTPETLLDIGSLKTGSDFFVSYCMLVQNGTQKRVLLITDSARKRGLVPQLSDYAERIQARIAWVEYASAAEENEQLVFYTSDAEESTTPEDVVLFLIDLEEEGGFQASLELLERISGSEDYSDVPVILVGDPNHPEAMIRAFEAGAADFVCRGPSFDVELPARMHAAVQRNAEIVRLKSTAGDLRRMTEDLKTANIIFRSISIHDELTGVPNRRFFDRYLDISWRQAMRNHAPLSLLMIDVDYFKKYNDTYGHQAGDRCLRSVAGALESTVADNGCILARYGGEEFAAILPDIDSEQAREIAERLRDAVYALDEAHGESPHERVTVSLGLATAVPGLLSRPSKLIEKADRALYQAKNAGRNTVGS